MGVDGTQHYANGTPAVNAKFPDLASLVAYGHRYIYFNPNFSSRVAV